MQKISKPDLNKFQFTENRIGILIIIGTIAIYHFIVFETKTMGNLPEFALNNFFYVIMILPGLISATVYRMFIKKLIKIFSVGVLTIILWYVWIITYASLTFTIR